jgi:hypothetical protein
MVGDHYRDKWTPRYPDLPQWPDKPLTPFVPGITREEFDALKKEVEEMKALLKRREGIRRA